MEDPIAASLDPGLLAELVVDLCLSVAQCKLLPSRLRLTVLFKGQTLPARGCLNASARGLPALCAVCCEQARRLGIVQMLQGAKLPSRRLRREVQLLSDIH